MEHDLSKTMAELPSAGNQKGGSGRWKSMALAIALPLALAALLWFVFREQLAPAVPVETARIILLESEGGTDQVPTSGKPELLFQASGWVEPDPWHVSIAVKTDGYVDEVFIREGDAVTNGQLVATLDPADTKLDLAVAQANVQKYEAAWKAQQSRADAEVKQAEAALYRVEAAVARLTRERDTAERFTKSAPGVVSHVERVTAEQAVVEFEAEEKAARAALTALEARAVSAQAEIKVAEAALAAARDELAVAQLALDRTTVRSPINGLILRRFVKPGDKRMVMADDPHSAHIAEVYDPQHLQVRVDVPLSEAGKMKVGQPARITTAMLPGQTFDGRIISIIGQADLQRNTLQAKVVIDAPDPRMRPDVLCRVEFFGVPTLGNSTQVPTFGNALWIPIDALETDANEQHVWVVDPITKTAVKRTVRLSNLLKDEYRGVLEGLRANELVVVRTEHPLKEGSRVKEIEL
ncbi:efflux RND transporter periplasmic adaptor subunit [Pontiellaceae bacterium B1224]|nr:efflux RND transporter periplasmic adaptor subunit [Pontiellaceae bacterium B1224]